MVRASYFSPATFRFLADLEKHNDRKWFAQNKERYEQHVKEPAARFGEDAGAALKMTPHAFRIHRDVRFSKDKSPYKTQVGIRFARDQAMDTAPGFYLHVEKGGCFVAGGIHVPAGPTLLQIRKAIVKDPKGWQKVVDAGIELAGESLKRPPQGFDADAPHLEDLKRKEFIGTVALTESVVGSDKLFDQFMAACESLRPLDAFLLQATR